MVGLRNLIIKILKKNNKIIKVWTSEKDGFNHIYLKGLDGSQETL